MFQVPPPSAAPLPTAASVAPTTSSSVISGMPAQAPPPPTTSAPAVTGGPLQASPSQTGPQQQQPPPPNHHHHHHHHHPQPLTCTGPPSVGKGPRNQQQPAFNSTAVQYGPPPVAPILHHPAGQSPPLPPGWQQHKASPASKVPRDAVHERLMKKAKSRQQQQQQQSLQQGGSSQHSTPATSPAKRGVKGKEGHSPPSPLP